MSAQIDQSRWAAAFEAELDRAATETGERVLNSVFFGGGTPSLMEVATVDRIMDRVRKHWRLANDLEVTLEANPTSIEAGRFQGYRGAGVNRVSIGVQALNDADLRRLGRLHSAREALEAVELARSTFDRVSFDLIYARQDQSVKDWEAELRQALALEPDHLSLYQLTIEDGTAFGDRFRRGSLRGLPNEDLGAELWDITQNVCEEVGLLAYEVSNHASIGQESRHNLIYWKSGDWLGIGPGAHGRLTLNKVRHETVAEKAPGAWLAAVEAGSGETECNALTVDEALEERLMMGLRLREGVYMPSSWIRDKINVINNLVDIGVIEKQQNCLIATASGRPVLNSVLSDLLLG